MVHDERAASPTPGAAFYAVADSAAFLGVVGLLNSLRLVGHDEPFLLLDCGLTDEQRSLLAPHATIVAAPPHGHPTLLKPVLPLARPAEVMVLLDADVVVVRDLSELVAAAATSRRIVAFENDVDRYRPEWGELLALGSLPRRRYVNAGHLLLPFELGVPLLQELEEATAAIGLQKTLARRGELYAKPLDDPFFYADQDVLNALLARVPEERLLLLESRLAAFPPFAGIMLRSDSRILCEYPDGNRPYLLHHVLRKPWLAALPDSVYAAILRRLLSGPGIAVRVPVRMVPVRLREGSLARADRARAHVQALLRDYTRGRLKLRPRLAALRSARRSAGS